MNVRRALTTGLLVLATAAVAAVPVAASAAAPVTVRGEGWTQQGTFDDPVACQTTGVEGVGAGQWALFACSSNDEGTWDLWASAG